MKPGQLRSIGGDPILNLVYNTVRDYVKKHQRLPSEARKAIVKSGQIKTLINNLTLQLKQVQETQLKRGRKKIGEKTLRKTCEELTELFIKGFENLCDRRRESEMEKYKRIHAGDDVKDMESTLQGKSTGVFEDMGLVIPKSQQDGPQANEPTVGTGKIISLPPTPGLVLPAPTSDVVNNG